MIKRIAVILFSMTSLAGSGEGYSDETIKQTFIDYLRPRTVDKDFDSPGRKELIDVVQLRSDTNRLARLLVELARTNDAWYVDMAMWQLEKYATSEQLPFLYSCATNPASLSAPINSAVSDKAIRAILNVEGVTSNSVAILKDYLMKTWQSQYVHWDKTYNCEYLVNRMKKQVISSNVSNQVMNVFLQYANSNNICVEKIDKILIGFSNGYKISKRRLKCLRSVHTMGVDEYCINYVTNAIGELVAYPEADLPE